MLPYPNKPTVQEIPAISLPGSIVQIQSSTVCSVPCSNGIHDGSQGSQAHGSKQGYKNPPVPRRLVGQSHFSPILSLSSQTLVAVCQELGWIVNTEKSELAPKQIFEFVGYHYDPREGKVRLFLEHWQTLKLKTSHCLGSSCP